MRLLCPYCYKEVRKVEGSKQFNHLDPEDFFVCWKIPTHAIEREAPHAQ